ncbi:hypothetical protein M9458_033361 [Cirrhinus mrigala]|uniref:Uncharacterized protein n=1 Tax=Cirrhinus mrigala TaxID=683832 RepID=A0ABD0PH11_CIRMR
MYQCFPSFRVFLDFLAPAAESPVSSVSAPALPEVAGFAAEPPKSAASAPATPEVAALAAEPPESAASASELCVCSVMAKEAVVNLFCLIHLGLLHHHLHPGALQLCQLHHGDFRACLLCPGGLQLCLLHPDGFQLRLLCPGAPQLCPDSRGLSAPLWLPALSAPLALPQSLGPPPAHRPGPPSLSLFLLRSTTLLDCVVMFRNIWKALLKGELCHNL